MVRMAMDISREKGFGESKSFADSSHWRPLPLEAGIRHNNNVVMSLLAPGRWGLFQVTPDKMSKYGLAPTPVFTDAEWGSLYFMVPTHRVEKFQHESGHEGFASVICPIEMNKYLVEGLGLNPMFDTPVRCAHCEAANRAWEDHNARWEELGIDKKALSTDGYRQAIKDDPILAATRNRAYDLKAVQRYVFNLFDHDKSIGVRPLDEGETQVQYQSWYAPFSVYEKVRNLYEALASSGATSMFFDLDRPSGVQLMTVVKDTTECSGKNMMRTKYDVINTGAEYQYAPEWLTYLRAESNWSDPSSYLKLISYEEGKFYVQAAEEQTQVYNRAAPTPAAPVPPTPAAPVPPIPQAPVVTKPDRTPPVGAAQSRRNWD